MSQYDELETSFREDVLRFSLCFRKAETEDKYYHYKLHEKKAPSWFKWLLWSFVIMLVLRRVQLLAFVELGVPCTATDPTVEIITVTVLLSGLLCEGLALLFVKLSLVRGFPFLVASFFTIAHSSHEYYPNKPAIITM